MTANSNCSTRGDTFWIWIDLRFYSDCKYFVTLIIRCRKYFECLIFGHHCASEIFLTPKLSKTTVCMYMCVSQAWKSNLSQETSIRDPRECCISHSVHETVELTDQGKNSGVRQWRSGGWWQELGQLRMPGVKESNAERSQWQLRKQRNHAVINN